MFCKISPELIGSHGSREEVESESLVQKQKQMSKAFTLSLTIWNHLNISVTRRRDSEMQKSLEDASKHKTINQ